MISFDYVSVNTVNIDQIKLRFIPFDTILVYGITASSHTIPTHIGCQSS